MPEINRDRHAPKSQIAMTVYLLADCPECHIQYAIIPDPLAPSQNYFFDRNKSLTQATHICAGGYLCLSGHQLTLTHPEAVYTNDGQWVALPTQPMDCRNN